MLEGALPVTGGAFAVFLLHSSASTLTGGPSQGLAVEEMSLKAENGFV
jgi:hypothetical protein